MVSNTASHLTEWYAATCHEARGKLSVLNLSLRLDLVLSLSTCSFVFTIVSARLFIFLFDLYSAIFLLRTPCNVREAVVHQSTDLLGFLSKTSMERY